MPRRKKQKPQVQLTPMEKFIYDSITTIIGSTIQTTMNALHEQKSEKELAEEYQQIVQVSVNNANQIAARSEIASLQRLLKHDLCQDSTLKIHAEIGRIRRQHNLIDPAEVAQKDEARKVFYTPDGQPKAVVLE